MNAPKQPEPYLCKCDSLDEAADDPNCSIIFNEMMNEYQLESRDGRGHYMIRHCPFCGGRTPASRRDRLFARPPREEFRRLKELTNEIRTLEDALRIFGKPEQDYPDGISETKPASDGEPPVTKVSRAIWYFRLSDTVDVCISEGASGGAKVSFQHKELTPDALPPAEAPIRARDLRATQREAKETLFCALCGKTQHEAKKMVQGMNACICDECVDICSEALNS